MGLYSVGFEEMTLVLFRKSLYLTALLGVENAEGAKYTVELNVDWSI